MARFYATFNNSTNSTLENSEYRDRLVYTNGSTLRQALVSARSTLSAEVYGDIPPAYQDGSIGTVIPRDLFTVGSPDTTWSNIVTNNDAIWPADPSVRPTSDIPSGPPNSSPASPAVPGSILTTYYTDATTAVANAIAGIAGNGPFARPGLGPTATLYSLYHPHDLSVDTAYFAWDDFTPGTVQNLAAGGPVGTAASGVTFVPNWTYQYRNDANPNGLLQVTASLGGPENYSYNSGVIAAGPTEVTWEVNGGNPISAGTYEFVVNVFLWDATIPGNQGQFAQLIVPSVVIS